MAAVRGVGVSLSLQNLAEFGLEADPNMLNLDARLFADLHDWQRIVDPAPQSFALGGPVPSGPNPVAELRDSVLMGLQDPRIPSGHRQSTWGSLIGALSDAGVQTDGETLKSLPVRLELTDELVERLLGLG